MATHVSEGYPRRVDDIGAVSAEHRVRLVLHDEHDVGGDVGGRLVSLFGEGDLGALFPAGLDVHGEDLVLGADRAAVRVQPLARDLHLLGAAGEHVLQTHLELVNNRRVFLLVPRRACAAGTGLKGPGKAAHAAHAERGEGVVHVHVVAVGEELIEGAAAAEELSEHGVRVSVERVARAIGSATSGMTFESWRERNSQSPSSQDVQEKKEKKKKSNKLIMERFLHVPCFSANQTCQSY